MREKEKFYFHLNAARQMEIEIFPPSVSSDNYLIVPELSFKTPFRGFPAAVCPSGQSAVTNPVEEEICKIYNSGGAGVDVYTGCGDRNCKIWGGFYSLA